MAKTLLAEKNGLHPGKRIGMQTFVRFIERVNGNYKWLVRCDCGNEREVFAPTIYGKGSCGCQFRKRLTEKRRANGYFENLAGQRFGRLVAVERVDVAGKREPRWLCRCDCGAEALKQIAALKAGATNKCKRTCPLGPVNSSKTHGESAHGPEGVSRLYRIWLNMRTRCSNPKAINWERYGGRGIAVCDEWEASYEAFRDWALANGYADHLSIDRENNAGSYEPGNCRWVTAKEQANNRRPARTNRWIQARARSDAAHEGLQDAAKDAGGG